MTTTKLETFAAWQAAAVAGYERGGLCPDVAAAIVRDASNDIEPLARGGLTRELRKTFCALLDANAAKWFRRYGCEIFAMRH